MEKGKMDEFLNGWGKDEEKIKEIGLTRMLLEEIYDDFVKRIPQLERTAEAISNVLLKIKLVHSVRYRVKNPKTLLEKIIRKKTDDPKREITVVSYLQEITDLIGVRALHLYKDQWPKIHELILETWDLKEPPVAYYRAGDPESYISMFKKKDCETKEHPFGYRSLHFVISTKPEKTPFFAEIQVRTIFEEGWSEIDHIVRYPSNSNNKLLVDISSILNRISGMADEMGTFIKSLDYEILELEHKNDLLLQEKNNKIQELERIIKESDIEKGVKIKLNKQLTELGNIDYFKIINTDLAASIFEINKRAEATIGGLKRFNPLVLKPLVPYGGKIDEKKPE
jgi:putative GTP pyrophosphokinase